MVVFFPWACAGVGVTGHGAGVPILPLSVPQDLAATAPLGQPPRAPPAPAVAAGHGAAGHARQQGEAQTEGDAVTVVTGCGCRGYRGWLLPGRHPWVPSQHGAKRVDSVPRRDGSSLARLGAKRDRCGGVCAWRREGGLRMLHGLHGAGRSPSLRSRLPAARRGPTRRPGPSRRTLRPR